MLDRNRYRFRKSYGFTVMTPAGRYAEQQFRDDIYDLFTGRRSGHVSNQIYQGGLSQKFNSLADDPNYYPYFEDMKILDENFQFFRSLAAGGTRKNPVTVIELGPGPSFDKSDALLKAMRPNNYVAVDTSLESLYINAENVQTRYPGIKRFSRHQNFYTDDIVRGNKTPPVRIAKGPVSGKIPKNGRRIVVQLGTTLSNMEGFVGQPPPKHSVVTALSHVRSFMREGDLALISVDQCQRQADIEKCYSSDTIRQIVMTTLERIPEFLPVTGFSAADYRYTTMWCPKSNLFGLGWQSVRDHGFDFEKERITVKKDDVFLYTNSYRYPRRFLDEAFKEAGFCPVRTLTTPAKRMHLHVLEAC